jgi:uncharacterized phage protein (TIGR02220 family)
MADGYFNIHRQIFDSWVFADDKALKIWIWLIGKARHKKGFVPLKIGKGTITVKLDIGQLLFGRHKAEEALCFDGSLIYRKLKKFEEDKMIKIESNNQYSIITICKYVDYQEIKNSNRTTNEQPTNSRRTAGEQQANTNNKENNYNKEIVFFLNLTTGKNYKHTTDKTKTLINARLKEGFTLEDFKKVIQIKTKDWLKTDNEKYLRPETLFGTKFEGYLNSDKSHSSSKTFSLPSSKNNADYNSIINKDWKYGK